MPGPRFTPLSPGAIRTRQVISGLVHENLTARDLLDEVGTRLRRVVPFDSGSWWTVDSETLLPTELADFTFADVEREVNEDDVNRLIDLDERRLSSASLALATEGIKNRSARYVSTHIQAGIGDEMRILARSGTNTWGAACLIRGDDMPDFTAAEVRYAGSIAHDVGLALRGELLRIATTRNSASSGGAGTLILSADDTIEGFTPEATHWMRRLGIAEGVGQLPTAMRWVSLQARAQERSNGQSVRVRAARSRIPLADGDFVVVKAEPLHGSAESKVVMTFEPASRASLLTLLMALHDLTPREKELAELLVNGWAVPDIARELALSPHTVRDHVKAIYTKVGVRSRPELTAHLGGVTDSYSSQETA